MIPAYGTRADYVSGRNYPAKGSVVYNFPPLSYIAKHDNLALMLNFQVMLIRTSHTQSVIHIVR